MAGALACFAASHNSSAAVAAATLIAAASSALGAALFGFVGYVATGYAIGTGSPTAETLREFAASHAPNYTTWAIGDTLGGACFLLLYVPVVGTAFGAIVAAIRGRHRHQLVPLS